MILSFKKSVETLFEETRYLNSVSLYYFRKKLKITIVLQKNQKKN